MEELFQKWRSIERLYAPSIIICKCKCKHTGMSYLISLNSLHFYDDDDDGLPAYSHHDKIPPWWECVSNVKGGNVSVSKSHHTG